MIYLVDEIGKVVTAMQSDAILIAALTTGIPELSSKGYLSGMPYYMYDHPVKINARLLEKNQDKTYKYQKYPLVALRLDFDEEPGLMWGFNLNIAIIMATDPNYGADKRYDKVYRTVLYPIYEAFLKHLKSTGLFQWDQDDSRGLIIPPHKKVDRLFYGAIGSQGNEASIFSDPLDAIELINLKIYKRDKNC